MKLSSVIAFAAVVLGVTACAVGSSDEAQPTENTGTTQQAMCLNYPDCIVKTGSRLGGGGFTTSGGLVFEEETPQTFTCNGKASLCLDPNNHWLSCNSDRTSCVCMQGCGGGGWPYGTYNPCLAGKTYTCTSYGYCTCR